MSRLPRSRLRNGLSVRGNAHLGPCSTHRWRPDSAPYRVQSPGPLRQRQAILMWLREDEVPAVPTSNLYRVSPVKTPISHRRRSLYKEDVTLANVLTTHSLPRKSPLLFSSNPASPTQSPSQVFYNTLCSQPVLTMATIVELSNYKETLTPWDPNAKSQLYAIVDMGRYASPSDC